MKNPISIQPQVRGVSKLAAEMGVSKVHLGQVIKLRRAASEELKRKLAARGIKALNHAEWEAQFPVPKNI